MQNHRVEILNKKFKRKTGIYSYASYDQTAEIIFYNDDGSIRETATYGYVSPDVIQEKIKNNNRLYFKHCYINNVSFADREYKSINAFGSFFDTKVNFSNVKFSDGAVFKYTTFFKDISRFDFSINCIAEFDHAVFFGDFNYYYLQIDCPVHFTNVIFHGRADFSNSIFNGLTNFHGAIFSNAAYFQNVTFKRDIDFDSVVFNENAIFGYSSFCGVASFQETEFLGDADFIGAVFAMKADLVNIIARKAIIFNDVKFDSFTKLHFQKCNKVILDQCIIEKACILSSDTGFRRLSLKKCICFGKFSVPFNDNLKTAIYDYEDVKYAPKGYSFKEMAQEFNFLKVNYYLNGEYEHEDQAYVEYRRCLRKTKNRFIRGMEWFLLDKISCYCTKPFHVFYAALIAIVTFAALYFIPGIISFQYVNQPVLDISFLQQLWNSIYHSVITFFTIGYGNSIPSGWIGLFLTGLEGFVGVFLMSLFTISFVRKVLR